MAAILLAGLNHRTATIDIRERFSLHTCGLDVVHDELRRVSAHTPALQEMVVISTCNRLEVYAASEEVAAGRQAIIAYLANLYGAEPAAIAGLLYFAHDEEAVRHLLRVTCGLDSMILGEPQILGQVADAARAAQAAGSQGPLLSHLFSQALHCGKRARAETAIGSHTISISHAAALLAEHTLGNLPGRQALVIGAGEMAETAAIALRQHGVTSITCVNRTHERALRIAERVGGRALAWTELDGALDAADVVISATSAPHPVLLAPYVATAQARRSQRPLLLLDIAMPRDIDVAVDGVPGVTRFDIDHLRDTVDANLARRQAAVPLVERIIAGETACYLSWLHERQVVPALVELRRRAAGVMAAEVERTMRRLEHRSSLDAVEQEVELLAHRLVAKLLHTPTVQLKAQAANGNGAAYAHVLAELFALHDPNPDAGADAGADAASNAGSNCNGNSNNGNGDSNSTGGASPVVQPAAYRNGYSSHE
jgi:glutamyl-tRNA reductase